VFFIAAEVILMTYAKDDLSHVFFVAAEVVAQELDLAARQHVRRQHLPNATKSPFQHLDLYWRSPVSGDL